MHITDRPVLARFVTELGMISEAVGGAIGAPVIIAVSSAPVERSPNRKPGNGNEIAWFKCGQQRANLWQDISGRQLISIDHPEVGAAQFASILEQTLPDGGFAPD